MASAAIHGRIALLYVGAGPTKIGELREVTLTVERATVDVTSHDSQGWMENIHGNASWNLSAETLYISADAGQDAVFSALTGETTLDVEFRPEGDGLGEINYSGTALITSWEVSGPNDDAQAVAIELVGTGALVEGTQA